MTEWEYRKIDLNQQRPPSDEVDMLNAAGAGGWGARWNHDQQHGVFETPDRRACSSVIRVQQRHYTICKFKRHR